MTRPISPGQADAHASQRLKAQHHAVGRAINQALVAGDRIIDVKEFIATEQAHAIAAGYRHEGWEVSVEDRRMHMHATTAWRFHFRVTA